MIKKGYTEKQLKNLEKRKRFGYEQPPAKGRPPLSPEVKIERKRLREMLESIAPDAVQVLQNSMRSKDEKNRIRASEIALSHTVPKLSEGVIDLATTPLTPLPDEAVTEILTDALNATAPTPASDGNGGNGAEA